MSSIPFLSVACIIVASLFVDGYRHAPKALLHRTKVESLQSRESCSLQMSRDYSGENPVSMRQHFLSNSRNLMISFSVVALSTGTLNTQRAAAEMATAEATRAPMQRATEPIITSKVYLDIKIANYTEESTGTNKGADGSGRVVFGLYGKDAPDSVARVRQIAKISSTILIYDSYCFLGSGEFFLHE
jgi:hypothetical protein